MTTTYKSGRLRGDKIEYSDGIGCCVWYPFPSTIDTELEESGLAFDFNFSDIDDFINLLQQLKYAKADKYEEITEDSE